MFSNKERRSCTEAARKKHQDLLIIPVPSERYSSSISRSCAQKKSFRQSRALALQGSRSAVGETQKIGRKSPLRPRRSDQAAFPPLLHWFAISAVTGATTGVRFAMGQPKPSKSKGKSSAVAQL